MFKYADFSQQINELFEQAEALLHGSDLPFNISEENSERLSLVFAGQYSAGKSSILKMLTGNTDISIGAGITTQKAHAYEWNGLNVIDTPGIHTQLRPDHDAISYDAIAHSDLLVFVITNELFDSFLASHFRKLAIDQDKAREMILVVNKMCRTSNGNTPEQQKIISVDLQKVLSPYAPEDMYISFLDAESYLDGLEEQENDPELSNELISRSGYDQFIETLNRFVNEKGLASRLTTKIYLIENQLQNALDLISPKDKEDDLDALEENYLRQKLTLVDARNRLQQEIKDIFLAAASKIRIQGLDTSNLLTDDCDIEAVEKSFSDSVDQANTLIDECQSHALEVIKQRLNELNVSMEDIEQSEFSKRLKNRLLEKFDQLPEAVQKAIGTGGVLAKKTGEIIVKGSYAAGVSGGLKLSSFSKSTVHNLVVKAGHAFKVKFKPWQAVKVTRFISFAGQGLSVLGNLAEVFMQIKADHDEDKRALALKENRQAIRGEFYSAANNLEDYGRQFAQENIVSPLDSSVSDITSNIMAVRESREGQSALYREIIHLQEKCDELIREIHQTLLVDESQTT